MISSGHITAPSLLLGAIAEAAQNFPPHSASPRTLITLNYGWELQGHSKIAVGHEVNTYTVFVHVRMPRSAWSVKGRAWHCLACRAWC